MKEMIYQADSKREILDTGYCFGILYYTLNLGTHPTAYIKVPDDYEEDERELDVHGGCTYDSNYLYISENKKIEGHFIGWDYAHYTDYLGFQNKYINGLAKGKKWTTEEIFREVKEACYKIQNSKEKQDEHWKR